MSDLTVRDLMQTEVVTVSPHDTVAKARDLMYSRWFRHLPVVDREGRLIGMVTHRDLLRKSLIEQADVPPLLEQAKLEAMRVAEAMFTIVDTVTPETRLADAGRVMLDNKVGFLPVVEGRRLVGILTEADFVRYVIESDGERATAVSA